MSSKMRLREKLITMLPDRALNIITKRKSSTSMEKRIKRVKRMSPEFLEIMSEKRLISAFHRAAKEVPHYRKFLQSESVDIASIKNLNDFIDKVPVIDKKSYIQTISSLEDLCVSGRICDASLLSRSSGFSGKPCIWPCSQAEEERGRRSTCIFFEYLLEFSKYKTLVINAFSQGTWVSGTGLSRLMLSGVSFCVTGTNDKEIIEIVDRCRSGYDQIIIFGYPPFLKLVLEQGKKNRENFWMDDSTRFILMASAEGFSEGWREYINNNLNHNRTENHVYSTYGASDLGIVGFTETPFTVKIRQAAYSCPDFAELVFNKKSRNLPMLFSYNPLQYHIRINERYELEFSTLSPDTLVPLMRYNIHDLGGVVTYEKMRDMLVDADLKIDMDLPAPLFYVYGRSTGEIPVCGGFVYPDNIRDALFSDPDISSQITGAFKLNCRDDEKGNLQFYVDIELLDIGISSDELKDRYEEVLHGNLCKVNMDYAETVESVDPTAKVQVVFKEQGEIHNNESIKIHYS
ncbi:hypothetical protein GF312_15190 [Candidatus Poribacteria bacterium]|nr:hypothetical protein [Candidatus Poribacteria bacterium]